MVRIFNDEPRPRALFEDLDDGECAPLRRLFPSDREIAHNDSLYEPEADVLVTRSDMLRRHGQLHVVAFGSKWLGTVRPPPDSEAGPMSAMWIPVVRVDQSTTLARRLVVPDSVAGELGALVREHLVPLFSSMDAKPTLSIAVSGGPGLNPLASGAKVSAWCRPFLLAGDGSVLAASFRRAGGGLCWVLPADVPDPVAWVAAALQAFREDDPDRIPALPAWWVQPRWAAPEQERARHALTELEAERLRLISDLDRRLIAAREDVRVADEAAAKGVSRLLSADGDELANAVMDALEVLGYRVEDMDERFPEGQRREDLRVQDPDRPGWEAIVEVKGYTRGAAVNDLARLARWSGRYAADHAGRLPDAQWHVVNAFRELDPSARPQPIPNEDDLRDFSEDGGLLIDTRELFSAWRAVVDGSAITGNVREELRGTRGRWQFHGL